MKRSVQKRDPAGRIQPSQGDEPMKVLASPKPTRQRPIPIEDKLLFALFAAVIVYSVLEVVR